MSTSNPGSIELTSSESDAPLQSQVDGARLFILQQQQHGVYTMKTLELPDRVSDTDIVSLIRTLPTERAKSMHGVIQTMQRIFTMRRLVFGKVEVLELQILEAQDVSANHINKKKRDKVMTGLLRDVAPILPTTPGSIRDHLAKGVRGHTHAGHIYV